MDIMIQSVRDPLLVLYGSFLYGDLRNPTSFRITSAIESFATYNISKLVNFNRTKL